MDNYVGVNLKIGDVSSNKFSIALDEVKKLKRILLK